MRCRLDLMTAWMWTINQGQNVLLHSAPRWPDRYTTEQAPNRLTGGAARPARRPGKQGSASCKHVLLKRLHWSGFLKIIALYFIIISVPSKTLSTSGIYPWKIIIGRKKRKKVTHDICFVNLRDKAAFSLPINNLHFQTLRIPSGLF